jgi:hypothetical protein
VSHLRNYADFLWNAMNNEGEHWGDNAKRLILRGDYLYYAEIVDSVEIALTLLGI